MKTLASVFLAFTALTTLAHAQGTLNFANGAAGINMPVWNFGGQRVTAADNTYADLFYGPTLTSATNALGLQVPVGTVSAGYFFGGVQAIPGAPAGGSTYVKIVLWIDGYSDRYSRLRGESPTVLVSNLGGGNNPPPSIPLGTGFLLNFAPAEPSSAALVSVGLAALLCARRRERM